MSFATAAPASLAVPALADDTVAVSYSIVDDWGGGFQAALTITNNASWSISDWNLQFDAPWEISNIWGASIQSHAGLHFTLVHASTDDASIAPGQTVTMGWIGAPGSPAEPASPTLNGAPISLHGTSPAPRPDPPVPAPVWPARFFSPFVDATIWPLFNVDEYAQMQNVPFVSLGFITALDGTECQGAWGGFAAYSVASGFRLPEINHLRKHGGDVRVSFGGAAGHELAVLCDSVESTRAAYQAAIDAYGLTHIDFDIEGEAVNDPPSIDRRSQAIKLLQDEAAAEDRTLWVSVTLPVLPTGLVSTGLYVIDSALTHGVRLDGVNIMAMDYGSQAAPNPEGKMGEYAMSAATNLHAQLTAAFASHGVVKTPEQVWALIGVTPMIGVNDVVQEIFDTSNANQVVAFAESVRLGSLSFWDANRDHPCELPVPQPNNFCSGTGQQEFQFSQITRQYPSPATAADINADGVVDGADLGYLLGEWNRANAAADLNRDGTVDGADLGQMLGAWNS